MFEKAHKSCYRARLFSLLLSAVCMILVLPMAFFQAMRDPTVPDGTALYFLLFGIGFYLTAAMFHFFMVMLAAKAIELDVKERKQPEKKPEKPEKPAEKTGKSVYTKYMNEYSGE